VHGRVQGVFFRDSTRRRARALGLLGWVCNRPDGSVEVLAEGETRDLQALVEWLHQGPELARVREVDVSWSEATGELDAFRVR
jgi:acylphosphatase